MIKMSDVMSEKLISISYDNYMKLSMLKKHNPERRGMIDTYNDVIEKLLKDHEKKLNPGGIR